MLRHKVWALARDLDGRVTNRVLRAAFAGEGHAIQYAQRFANDTLNWRIDFEITTGD